MTSAQLTEARIETYLDRLQSALRGVSPDYQQDILREIRAHIMDSSEHSADQAGTVESRVEPARHARRTGGSLHHQNASCSAQSRSFSRPG